MDERYWSQVTIRGEDECWPWRDIQENIYGYLHWEGRTRTAHSVGLELTLGRPIADGMIACHTCDFRPCQNPQHLFEGTYAANSADMVAKNRQGQPRRLSSEQHQLILSSQLPSKTLARQLGVATNAVWRYRQRYGWRV